MFYKSYFVRNNIFQNYTGRKGVLPVGKYENKGGGEVRPEYYPGVGLIGWNIL